MLFKPADTKNVRSVLLIMLLVIMFLAAGTGCRWNTNQSSAKESEETGNSGITRIISTAPSITEIIAGLGLANSLVAVDKYSRDVEGVQNDLPEIDFFYPDIEAITGLKPDIIIVSEVNTGGSTDSPYQFFGRLGIKVVEIPTSSSIEEIYRDILTIAKTLNVTEKGEELVSGMKAAIEKTAARVRETNGSAAGKKTVYFEITPAPNMVSFGRGTYLNELIEITGMHNIFAAEERWFTPGAEAIISANPDLIFILDGISDNTEIKSRPGFQHITAVKHNKIYVIDANHASRPSQNIVKALESMYEKSLQAGETY